MEAPLAFCLAGLNSASTSRRLPTDGGLGLLLSPTVNLCCRDTVSSFCMTLHRFSIPSLYMHSPCDHDNYIYRAIAMTYLPLVPFPLSPLSRYAHITQRPDTHLSIIRYKGEQCLRAFSSPSSTSFVRPTSLRGAPPGDQEPANRTSPTPVPPLTVCLITGPATDTLISCCLFLCGVIPSHIHGFYLSCTYFHRRKKARKGRYPGPPCAFIHDRRVWYGGLSSGEVERRGREVLEKKTLKENEKLSGRASRKAEY